MQRFCSQNNNPNIVSDIEALINLALNRTKLRPTMKKASLLTIAGLLTLYQGAVSAEAEPGISEERGKPWKNLISESSNNTVKVPDIERNAEVVNASGLKSTWERAQTNPDFILLADQIQSNDERLADAEQRIVDLEVTVGITNDSGDIVTGGAGATPSLRVVSIIVSDDPLTSSNGLEKCRTKIAQEAGVSIDSVPGAAVEPLAFSLPSPMWQCGPPGTTTNECSVIQNDRWQHVAFLNEFNYTTSTSRTIWRGGGTNLDDGYATPQAQTYDTVTFWGSPTTRFGKSTYQNGVWTPDTFDMTDIRDDAGAAITEYRCTGTVGG
ncbi:MULTISPECIES: hypothetical protein [Marinobacter]|uniref:Uncharacterized protein n=1 Tax=Marinobacter nauticus (strain ATCC 700491 / DSM 11845 / VT8) TaxID=351348 RepID=A1U7U3_MARN8|nr:MULTISPECIES: hypothetical protein [Marinobacter]ABM21062.1 hypothetical protein Maqu_4211 [Marinobacter nauticus VT8]